MQYQFNVFGKKMLVKRENQQWLLFNDADIGMPTRVYDVVIPEDMTVTQLAVYLDDIFHDYACDRHPNVFRINP